MDIILLIIYGLLYIGIPKRFNFPIINTAYIIGKWRRLVKDGKKEFFEDDKGIPYFYTTISSFCITHTMIILNFFPYAGFLIIYLNPIIDRYYRRNKKLIDIEKWELIEKITGYGAFLPFGITFLLFLLLEGLSRL